MATKVLRNLIDDLSVDLGLSLEELALLVGVSSRTVERWMAGTTWPQTDARKRLDELGALREHLLDVLGSRSALQAWMGAEHPALGRARPIDLLRGKRSDLVLNAADAIDAVDGAASALQHGHFV